MHSLFAWRRQAVAKPDTYYTLKAAEAALSVPFELTARTRTLFDFVDCLKIASHLQRRTNVILLQSCEMQSSGDCPALVLAVKRGRRPFDGRIAMFTTLLLLQQSCTEVCTARCHAKYSIMTPPCPRMRSRKMLCEGCKQRKRGVAEADKGVNSLVSSFFRRSLLADFLLFTHFAGFHCASRCSFPCPTTMPSAKRMNERAAEKMHQGSAFQQTAHVRTQSVSPCPVRSGPPRRGAALPPSLGVINKRRHTRTPTHRNMNTCRTVTQRAALQ